MALKYRYTGKGGFVDYDNERGGQQGHIMSMVSTRDGLRTPQDARLSMINYIGKMSEGRYIFSNEVAGNNLGRRNRMKTIEWKWIAEFDESFRQVIAEQWELMIQSVESKVDATLLVNYVENTTILVAEFHLKTYSKFMGLGTKKWVFTANVYRLELK